VDLEFAAIAGAGVDLPDAQCTPEHLADARLDARGLAGHGRDGGASVTMPVRAILWSVFTHVRLRDRDRCTTG